MAEQLGEAVLTVSADTRQLEAGLQRAQQQAQQTGQALQGAFNSQSVNSIQALQQKLQSLRASFESAEIGSKRFQELRLEIQRTESQLSSASGAALTASESFSRLAVQLGALEAGRRAFSFIVEQLKELDAGQAAVRTLGVNSEELTNKLRDLSQELGASVSVNELLKASYDVLSSGFTSSADATNILRASALGAQGGFAELGDVVKAVSGIINAYGLSSGQATKIVDGFLQTQNDGVITVRQYAAEIGNIASIAAAGGVGLDQLNAAIATATLRGVPVAQTFTGLRQALASIIKPSQQASELSTSLGLQFNVAALRSKGLAAVLADLQQKTGGSADKIAVLLGSVEAQAAIQPLLNDNLVKYNELLGRQAQSAGAASSASQINADTVTGNLKRIQNAFSNLATTLDTTLNPVFAALATNTNQALGALTKILSLVPKQAGTLNGAIAASLLFGPGVGIEVLRGQLGGGTPQPTPTPGGNGKGAPKPGSTPPASGAVISPAELASIQKVSDLELQGLRERLQLTQQLSGLDQASRTILENRLKLNEKLRDVQQTQVQLDREQAKPAGSGAGGPSERDPAKVLQLQNKLKASQVEIDTLRAQNQQSDAAALRTQQDKVRQQGLEAAAAQAKLAATKAQTRLELEALATGGQISRTKQLQAQQEQAIAAAKRQQAAAQQALQAELNGQGDRLVLDDLTVKLSKANADVRDAYASAGLSLVQNARAAADALKSAQQGFDSAARGGFQFLTTEQQQKQLLAARVQVQKGVDAGLIRSGVDVSTPEKLFQLAGLSDSLVNGQKALQDAIKENATATTALARKDWNVYVAAAGGLPQQQPPQPQVVGVINGIPIRA
jgi:TP901 family phage tail tape measure protein